MTDIQYNELYHGGQAFSCIKQYTQHKSIWLIALLISLSLHAIVLWKQSSSAGITHSKATSAMTTWLQIEEPLTTKPKHHQNNNIKPKHTQTKKVKPQQRKILTIKKKSKNKVTKTSPDSIPLNQKVARTPTTQSAKPAPLLTTASQQQALRQQLKQQYLAQVIQQVEQYKRYPKAARRRGIEGVVLVSFIIQHDGSIQHIQLKQGSNILQKAVRKAVSQASPFPPPPSSLPIPISCRFSMQFRLQS